MSFEFIDKGRRAKYLTIVDIPNLKSLLAKKYK